MNSKLLEYKINWTIVRLLILILIPVTATFLIFSYFKPFAIQSINKICENNVCNKNIEQNRLNSFRQQLESKNQDLKLLTILSNLPLTEIIFWNFKVTNLSVVNLSASNPQNKISEPVMIQCSSREGILLIPYNSGIIFQQQSKINEIMQNLETIIGSLSNCTFASQSFRFETGKGLIVAPEGMVTLEILEKYTIKPEADNKSTILTFLLFLIITLLALPILKQGYLLIKNGITYFNS